ncbi:VOC family protein [Corynebacterium guangdongense]
MMLEIITPTRHRTDVERVIPNLVVSNLHESSHAHSAVLGMDIILDHGFMRALGEVDGPQLNLVAEATPAPRPDATVFVTDVNAAYRRAEDASAHGIEIVYPLTDEKFGVRRFFYRDADGNVVSVAAHLS